MKVKGVIFEDFVNYKKPSMTIEFPVCDWKCERDCGEQVCQNSTLATLPDIEIDTHDLIKSYINNDITKSIVCLGLEPMDTYSDLLEFISEFRKVSNDDIVIYTGYTEEEVNDKIEFLKKYKNIIVKFGRYIPGQKIHYDEILGVNLASNNQYSKQIS